MRSHLHKDRLRGCVALARPNDSRVIISSVSRRFIAPSCSRFQPRRLNIVGRKPRPQYHHRADSFSSRAKIPLAQRGSRTACMHACLHPECISPLANARPRNSWPSSSDRYANAEQPPTDASLLSETREIRLGQGRRPAADARFVRFPTTRRVECFSFLFFFWYFAVARWLNFVDTFLVNSLTARGFSSESVLGVKILEVRSRLDSYERDDYARTFKNYDVVSLVVGIKGRRNYNVLKKGRGCWKIITEENFLLCWFVNSLKKGIFAKQT